MKYFFRHVLTGLGQDLEAYSPRFFVPFWEIRQIAVRYFVVNFRSRGVEIEEYEQKEKLI